MSDAPALIVTTPLGPAPTSSVGRRPSPVRVPPPTTKRALRSYLDAHRRLRQLVTELEAVSAQIPEQSLTTQRQAEAPGNQRR